MDEPLERQRGEGSLGKESGQPGITISLLGDLGWMPSSLGLGPLGGEVYEEEKHVRGWVGIE